jgi:uncharacterized protein with PhoU and TrkA domain
MPALIQTCVVIVTLGLLAIVMMTLRMMDRFSRAADDIARLSQAVRESTDRLDLVTQEARGIAISIRDFVPPVLRVVERFEAIGQRTADLSVMVLQELETPIFTAAAVARGVRSGTGHLFTRMMQRLAKSDVHVNGGSGHE